MVTPESIEKMIREFVNSLPPGLKTFKQEMENQLKPFLTSCFAKMSLVTREEFDIQCQVLIKTRLKLDQLEAVLSNMKETPKEDDITK